MHSLSKNLHHNTNNTLKLSSTNLPLRHLPSRKLLLLQSPSITCDPDNSHRPHKKLKVSFDLGTLSGTSAFAPQHPTLRAHRGKGKRLAHHYHVNPSSRHLALALPPSPPSDPPSDPPEKPYLIPDHKYAKEYEHSPLLTPKDDDDHHHHEVVQAESPNSQLGPSPLDIPEYLSPASEISDDLHPVHPPTCSITSNRDHIALKALVRLLEESKRQIQRDIAQLSALLQCHLANMDKQVAVDFFLQLLADKLHLPKPSRIPSTPVIDWGKYHPYLASAGREFEDVVSQAPSPLFEALCAFERPPGLR